MPVGKYLSNGMVSLYLDQDASSRLCASEPENDLWREIKAVIDRLHEKRRILIPLSLEHILETSRRGNRSDAHDEQLRKYAFGTSLHREYEISAAEMLVLARPRSLRRSDYFGKGIMRSLSLQPVKDEALNLNQRYSEIVSHIHTFPNQIKEITRQRRLPPLQEQLNLVEIRLGMLAKQLMESLAQFERGLLPLRLHFESSGAQIPRWNDVHCRVLASKFGVKPHEASRIRGAIQDRGLQTIPTLYARFKLSSLLDTRLVKLDIHDAFDVSRAACALSSSDVVVLDGAMASFVRDLGLDNELNCQVFSCKEREGSAFLTKLTSLL